VLAKKKKITKKQMKEDKLVTVYTKVLEQFEIYQKQVFIALGVIVVIVAGAYIYSIKQEENKEKATTELAKVLPLVEQKQYQQAIDGQPGTGVVGLKKLVEDYGGTEPGETAKLMLANAEFYLGNYDEALKYYESYSGSIRDMKAAAIAGQAACYENKGEFEKAANLFEKAAKVFSENANNPGYLVSAGKNYVKAGNAQAARKAFETVKTEYESTSEAKKIDRYLAEVELLEKKVS
jgi:tetratricopeptide (TPR) repeat protein